MFEMNKNYDREYIHTICGGNKQSFLPVKNGKVVAACLRQDLNPHAPDVIVCNSGAAARAAGKTLAKQAEPFPVFVKTDSDSYRYLGQYIVSESLTIPADCAPYAKQTGFTISQVSRVLKMNRR